VNYAVTATDNRGGAWRGYREQNGKLELAPNEQNKDDQKKNEQNISEVTVRRLGEFILPVTVHVKFEDGSDAYEHWDGQYRWTKFHYTKKVASAAVDEDWKWKLEIPRTDNTWVSQPNTLAADKWYLRWVVWIENVLNAFSYFS